MAQLKEHSDKLVERNDAPEIFCDGAHTIAIRNDVVRITLHSDRLNAEDGKTIERVTCARLAIPCVAFVDLYNQMHQVMQQLQQAGAVQAMSQGTQRRQ